VSCWNKEQLENMLEDVVNVLDLSESTIETHGPLGTPPAELVRIVLAQKDATIKMLRAGVVDCTPNPPADQTAAAHTLRGVGGNPGSGDA
jgi:hypothetical protein